MALLQIINLLHLMGISWGVGGATIAAIIMIKAGKDKKLAPLMKEVMPAISKLMWLALILLGISGIMLVPLVTWPVDSTILTIKHIAVVALVINAVFMTLNAKKKPTKENQKMAKASGMIGLALWYIIVVLSVIM